MADAAEVCGCNGVSKGTICKAIKDKGLFTLDDVRKHTKASASCGSCTGLVEQILMSTAGGDYSAAPKKKADVRLHRRQTHQRRARRDPRRAPADDRRASTRALAGARRTAARRCRPALNYYLISTWPKEAKDDPQIRFINERAHANIQKDGTYLGDPAHVGRRDQRVASCAASPTSSTSTRSRPSRSPAASASTCWA